MHAPTQRILPVTANVRPYLTQLSLFLVIAVFGFGIYTLDLTADQKHWWVDTGWTLASLLATWKCWNVSLKALGQYRVAWKMFAYANLAWFLGILYWDFQELVLGKETPFPALSDLGFLSLSIFFAIGFYFYYRPVKQASFTLMQFSKFGILFSGIAISQVAIFYGTIARGNESISYILVALAYPTSHIAMFLYNLSHFLAAGTSRQYRIMGLALASSGVHAFIVTLYAYALLGRSYQVGNYLDIYWIVAFFLMYLSAMEQEYAMSVQKQPEKPKPKPNLDHTRNHDVALSAFVMMFAAVIFLFFARDITPESMRWLTPLLFLMITFVSLREWASLRLERKLREAIHKSEQQLRSIAKVSPVGVFKTDAEGNCNYANEKWHEITGIKDLQGDRLNWLDIVDKEDRERVRQAWENIASHTSGMTVEFRLANTLPEFRWVLGQMVAEPGTQSENRGYVGSLTDITRQKNTELALVKSKADFESMFDSISDAVVYANEQRQIVMINPATTAIFGYSPEELVGKDTQQIYANTDDYEKTGATSFNKDARAPEDVYEMLYRRKDGSVFWGETIGTPVRDQQNNLLGYVGIIRDITERKKNEAGLKAAHDELEERIRERTYELENARIDAEKANAAKTEFLSRMSHELRTPMNAILGFAQLLDSDRDDMPEAQAESVHEILDAGYHLLHLINDTLDLSKIESGKLKLDIRPVMLEPLVQESILLVRDEAGKQSITINTDSGSLAKLQVLADPVRFKQVLINLMSNAIKYNRSGGSVDIRADSRNGRVYVAVQDTGIGIPQECIRDVFLPFTRVDAENNGIEGTGIGLTIALKMLKMMDGAIRVESSETEGSVFTLDLPAYVADDDRKLPHKASWANQAICATRKSILYIEDNHSNRVLIRSLLSKEKNIDFREAESAEQGFRLIAEQKPDLILLDIQMAGLNGFEMLVILQQNPETSDIPVIAMSGNALPADVGKGLSMGFAEYVTKPIDIDNLRMILRRILDKQPA
jgi:PAS domain S-box-containing protein